MSKYIADWVIISSMDNRIEITRSPKAFQKQLIIFSIVYYVLAILCAIMLFILFDSLRATEIIDVAVTGLIIAGLYSIASTILWQNWKDIKYYITPKSIIIKDRARGFASQYSEKIYTLESIKAAEVKQNRFSSKNGYGDVYLTIYPIQENVILKDVDRPRDMSEQIGGSIGVLTTKTV